MVWLHPFALFGLAAVTAPVLIHLLVHKRAPTLLFPTLRFVRSTRLAAIRRQTIDDLPLLLVRAAVLAAASAALAGPLLVTASRRAAWNGRLARAVVVDGDAQQEQAGREEAAAYRGIVIRSRSIAEGLGRASAWLNAEPPARREIVAISAFPLGALSGADVAAIPAGIGVRLVRAGALPSTATDEAEPTLAAAANMASAVRHTRAVVLDGDRTRVEDSTTSEAVIPIEIDTTAGDRRAADAALAAVLSERVLAPAPNRTARVVLAGSRTYESLGSASTIREAWMADAVASIARDPEWSNAARNLGAGLADPRFTRAPWQSLSDSARPIAAAAADGERLVVVSAAPAADLSTPLLIRSVLNSLAPRVGVRRREVVPMSDAELRAWQRNPAPVSTPDVQRVEDDDRRWMWAAALALLAIEARMRGTRARRAGAIGEATEIESVAHVA
jgi:aerotolerance regulator-like protein